MLFVGELVTVLHRGGNHASDEQGKKDQHHEVRPCDGEELAAHRLCVQISVTDGQAGDDCPPEGVRDGLVFVDRKEKGADEQ